MRLQQRQVQDFVFAYERNMGVDRLRDSRLGRRRPPAPYRAPGAPAELKGKVPSA
jgi:hypothetical protein